MYIHTHIYKYINICIHIYVYAYWICFLLSSHVRWERAGLWRSVVRELQAFGIKVQAPLDQPQDCIETTGQIPGHACGDGVAEPIGLGPTASPHGKQAPGEGLVEFLVGLLSLPALPLSLLIFNVKTCCCYSHCWCVLLNRHVVCNIGHQHGVDTDNHKIRFQSSPSHQAATPGPYVNGFAPGLADARDRNTIPVQRKGDAFLPVLLFVDYTHLCIHIMCCINTRMQS